MLGTSPEPSSSSTALPPIPYMWKSGSWGLCNGRGDCGVRFREVWCEQTCGAADCERVATELFCALYRVKPAEEEQCTGTCTSTTETTTTTTTTTAWPVPTLPPFPYTWEYGDWTACSGGGECGVRSREVWCEKSCVGPWCPVEENQLLCAQWNIKPASIQGCTGLCTSSTATTSSASTVTVTRGPTETTTGSSTTLGSTTALRIATSTTSGGGVRESSAGTSGSSGDSYAVVWTAMMVAAGVIVASIVACLIWGFIYSFRRSAQVKEKPLSAAAAAAGAAASSNTTTVYEAWVHVDDGASESFSATARASSAFVRPPEIDVEAPSRSETPPYMVPPGFVYTPDEARHSVDGRAAPEPRNSPTADQPQPPGFVPSPSTGTPLWRGAAESRHGTGHGQAAGRQQHRGSPADAPSSPHGSRAAEDADLPGSIPRASGHHRTSPRATAEEGSKHRPGASSAVPGQGSVPSSPKRSHKSPKAATPSSESTAPSTPHHNRVTPKASTQQRSSHSRSSSRQPPAAGGAQARRGRAATSATAGEREAHDRSGRRHAGTPTGAEKPPPAAPEAAVAIAASPTAVAGSTADIITKLDVELDATRGKDLDWRRKHFKGLMLRWHPDKNRESAEQAAEVMKHLLARRAAYLES